MNKTKQTVVEDDCEDQGKTPMPTHCAQFNCRGEKGLLVLSATGFVVCPNCGGSYGKPGPTVLPWPHGLTIRERQRINMPRP